MLHNTLFRLALATGLAGLAGCGDRVVGSDDTSFPDDTDGGDDTDASADTDDTDEPVINNPDNPDGLGPLRVELGTEADLATAGAYVLLSKTGITNVTGTMVTGGHIGVSPAGSTSITGFTRVPESAGVVFATSIAVADPGKVYAADYTSPTPANLTAAILSLEGAYTAAASRTNPDFLNLASGNLAGLTLAPGLYTWGSSVTIPDDVTVDGAANDVWIFQIENDLDISAGKSVLLAGAAQPVNIFWQVAGQVTIHENAHFEGIILSQTGITLQTNASFNGRALAQTLIALDDNLITAP